MLTSAGTPSWSQGHPHASGHQLPGLPACCLWHCSRVGKQAGRGVFGGTYGAGEKARTVRAGPALNYCCVPSSWHGARHVLEIGHGICGVKARALLFKGEGQQVRDFQLEVSKALGEPLPLQRKLVYQLNEPQVSDPLPRDPGCDSAPVPNHTLIRELAAEQPSSS